MKTIVDSTLYKRLVGSLMYLTATKLDIIYATSFVSRFKESPFSLENWKKNPKVCCRYDQLWFVIHNFSRSFTYKVHRKWLCGQHRWQKKHIWTCFSFGIKPDFMGIQETIHTLNILCRDKICSCNLDILPCNMAEKTLE